MTSPRKSRGQARRPNKLYHDLDLPQAGPEQVFDVHSVSDDSSSESITAGSNIASASANMPSRTKSAPKPGPSSCSKSQSKSHKASNQEVIEISTDGSVGQPEDLNDAMDMSDFEYVDVNGLAQGDSTRDGSEELEFEDVELDPDQPNQELQDMYAAAYREVQAKYGDGTADGDDDANDNDTDQADGDKSATKPIPIFKDGKGQHRAVEISVGNRSSKQTETKAKSNNFLTPRDRQNRITAHKLLVLSMLAHTKVRNKWCNDNDLRDTLADSVPDYLITKLRSIHPKKVTEQRERIRMFESFLSDLVRWWSSRFRLDPIMVANSALRQPDHDIATGIIPSSGRRIDGWIVETASEREQRHRRERREQQRYKDAKEGRAVSDKGKGKAKASSTSSASSLKPPTKAMEITIFAPGSAIRPIYLRLLPAAEEINSPAGLKQRAIERSGSRETSAQLFCALCRSLGIPARLVISPQPLAWSVGASKLANTAQPGSQAENKPNQLRARAKASSSRRFASKPVHELTSDEDGDLSSSAASSDARRKRTQKPISVSSLSSADEAAREASETKRSPISKRRVAKDNTDLAKKAVLGAAKNGASSSRSRASRQGNRAEPISVDDTQSDASSARSSSAKGKAATKSTPATRAEGKAKQADPIDVDQDDESDDQDYRPEKWKNLKTPLKVDHKVKLRAFRPKQLKDSEIAGDDSTADPVDLQAPPTMWVEVFSKPYQKWITVDPVRSLVRPSGNRHMEPPSFDRQNKLIYVVAFEEDGYARDVTARYTKTLNSRVSRLRPPTRAKGEEEWWSKVVRAIHRPQKLDRDAMEDAELQDNSSREPMPSSMAGFKDHPIYFLEKFLKRDEVVFPRRQIATFQGTPVFSKSDVQTLRSSRQWYNEGRVVKDGEVALKFVKARGYTLANKRAEEQARLEGRETAQEGLYAEFQTQLYVPPPVGDDGVIPTNGFGNIDLFVPSMLPANAVHLPHSGIAKVAKKLGVPYAEAITGFEFRKQRGMPKITGIVVAKHNAELVEEAFWQQEHEDALKQQTKKMERAMKNWRKLINAVRIVKRVKEQYGDKMHKGQAKEKEKKNEAQVKKTDEVEVEEEAKEAKEGEKSRFFKPKGDREEEEEAKVVVEYAPEANAEDEGADGDVAMTDTPSASSTSVKRKIISLAQLASTSSTVPDSDSDEQEESSKPTTPAKRSRRAAQPESAKRPKRTASSAPKAQEEASGQRRSTRSRTGVSTYTEPATDEEGEPDAEADADAQEHEGNRRTSRRITVKLKR